MLLPLLLAVTAADTVRYAVAFPNAVHHEARIEVEFPPAGRDTLEVWMSRSSPGRYALHEFAKNVYDVRVTDAAGRSLSVVRHDPYRWLVVAKGAPVRFSYTLFGDRADGTYTQVDRTHAHLNMPATFVWARGLERAPVRVRFTPPPGSGWRAATQLLPSGDPLTWVAPDLAYFMDSPVELADLALRAWTVTGPGGRTDTIRIAMHHQGSEAELDAFTEQVRKVVAEQVAVFGETARFDHQAFTFLADYLPWASGDGMEHRNSTVLSASGSLAHDAERLLATASHEFFHSWSMERIRSAEIEPFDFTRADPSHALWFGEGFTRYYDRLTIRRAGLLSDSAYAGIVAGIVNDVTMAPGRRFFSPMEMSLQAPFVDAATSIDPTNHANTYLSYYTWGAGVGLGLDLALRSGYEGKTLDGYMRLLWQRFGRSGRRYAVPRPYTVRDLERTLGEYAEDAGFAREFFSRYVRGREVPPYAELLQRAGMRVRPARPGAAHAGALSLVSDSTGLVVSSATLAGSPAYDAGLERGDVILSAGGAALRSEADWERILAGRSPGDEVPIVYRQRGQEVRAILRLTADPRVEVIPVELAGETPTEAQRTFRGAWLESRAVTR
ncbi:MAG TPA: PDZ domain-containing protein [Gemmatimonadales bacterium]